MFEIYEKLIEGLLEKGFQSVDNWFAPDELICLRKSLLKHYNKDAFHLAGIGNKDTLQTVEKIRNDNIFWLDFSKADDCEKQFQQKINDFVEYLNRTCFAGIRSYEFQYAVYEKGSFYKKHIDTFSNDDRRQFSLVCYLSDSWKEGDGGELLMYPGDTVVKINPLPGRIVFFRSDILHEVLLSNHIRLSLTGWMKTL